MSLIAYKDTGEFRFVFLLVCLFIAILVPPHFAEMPTFGLIWRIFFSLVLAAAAYSVIGFKRLLGPALILFVPTVITVWEDYYSGDWLFTTYLDNFTSIFYLSFISYHFIRYIVFAPRVTLNVIYASMCLYLMLAFIWAGIYANIHLYYSEAFNFATLDSSAQTADSMGHFTYFSFVTLTTLGYGDITPVNKVAQSWTAMQAMIGQFYIAILLARLVSLHASEK